MFSKLGMVDSEGDRICGTVEATFVRLLIAALVTLGYVIIRGQLVPICQDVSHWFTLRLVLPATAIGTWLGIWFSQIAYQNSDIAIAQTLLSTCPLFAIPIVWLVQGHAITSIGIAGTIFALAGIYLTVAT